ncbi:MAG: N-acetylglucosamine-6-phosphate deacetylase [Chitinophagaceae bacterium]|nr:N-acetylglucosamine-6-phosphate deacetylase [Chitinophagaceae bacterium]
MEQTIFAEKVFTGEGVLNHQLITCHNGVVTAVAPSSDNSGSQKVNYLSAGFNDIHINGGDKYYFTKTPDEESVKDIAFSSMLLGTAYTLPTIITSPVETIFKGVEAVKKFMHNHPDAGVTGMHLEGPFLHPLKRGAHLAEYLQKPADGILEEIIKYGKGVIKLMTIAPELFTGKQLEMLLASGITLSAGHSNATYEEAQAAFKKGIRLVTHLYNAMSGFGHRAPGLVGAAFDNPDVYAPVIIDGAHCDYAAARIAHKIKKEKLFLISDALFTGDKIKHFQWGNYDAFLKDGKYINSEGNLSGATISMGDAVRNAVNEVGIELQEAVEMATIRPALALGMENNTGKVKAGYPSVFTAFDESLKYFEVIRFN